MDLQPILQGMHANVSLPITRLGDVPESFDEIEFISLRFKHRLRPGVFVEFLNEQLSISENVISVVIPDTDTLRLAKGEYDLDLLYKKTYVNRPGGYEPFRLVIPAFQIVSESDKLTGVVNTEINIQTITIAGQILISRDGTNGATAFEIWKHYYGNEESTIEEYFAWVQQPANDAAAAFDVLVNDFNTFNAAAVSAEQSRQTNESYRNTNEDARIVEEQLRKTKDLARDLKEDERQLAEAERETLFDQMVDESTQATSAANTAAAAATAAANAQNTYNVTLAVPLPAGTYYTKTTARTAVQSASRKLGLIITYATADKVWYTERFIGSAVSGWTTESNWEQVPDATQVAQVRADLNTTNYNVEGLKGKTVADEEVSWLLPNDIDYFTGTYGNKNLGLYTKKMIKPISFSKVRLNSVSHNGNVQYKICIVNGSTDKRDCPTGTIADGTHLVLKSGTILMTTTAKDIYVDLGGVFTCPTGSQVVIYMSSLVSLNIYAKGSSGGIGNPDKTSNAVLFSSSTNPLDGGTWSAGSVNETTNVGYYSCALTLITGPTFAKTSDFNILKNTVDSLPSNNVDISLPDKIYAIIGDKLQLFYRGIVKSPNPYIYDILVSCQKGIQYPRYFEYLPTSGDVGTTTFKVEVKNKDGVILGTKICSLITKAVVQAPSTTKKILCIGDSLTSAGIWCIEASRRLVESGGTPAGLALSNIDFSGRKRGSGIGWEGTGGWTWSSYATAGVAAYRFYVSGVITPPAIGAVYTNNGGTFTVAEINITGGTGNIRCTSVGTPSASGALTKSSGIGDNTIAFSSSVTDGGNPFWYNGALNFKQYVDTYMNGACDVIYFLLTWNSHTPWRTDFTSMITTAKILIDHIHTQYPNCKLKIMGIQVPSLNGGMGANYGATGTGYADMYGMVVTAINMNKAYQDWCNEASYSQFLEFVNVSAQFDSENNMPEIDKSVNTRSAKTEKIGTNGVHPSTEGYYQIADVVFRNFVANFCQ